MPGRQSHGRAPTKKPKAQKINSKKRSQDAFAIASQQNPDKLKFRQHRLGMSEGGNRPGKRSRNDDDDDDEEEDSNTKKQRKSAPKGRFDELDIDEGSDSEGNEWKMGQVDSDDDSDLDSDEAFGESDEERFEGYAFSGSSNNRPKKKGSSNRTLNLDEEDVEESDSELEDGDLGDDAIDLAAMLDATEDDDEMVADIGDNSEDESSQTRKSKLKPADSDEDMEDSKSDGESEDESEESDESDDDSSMSSADDDPSKHAALQDLIANLPQAEAAIKISRHRTDGVNEQQQPTDAPIRLGDLSDLMGLNTGKQSKKKVKELNVPIAKRQQDRLDRTAAYEKTKETLDRWTDTVAHNRRAEHLMFPLPDPDGASHQANNTRLLPATTAKPFNELEATIQSILEESGLAPVDGKDDEDHLREYEELETKKMSVEEVKARRDQLRMARELMFREEAKAKRIKKIKSKSYRKVHRKQREKEERQNKEALLEGGFDPSEDELEAQDRRRATERMGAKHRGSKWAKETKQIGRAAWDEDARAGITDMARRDEELRKRVEGRNARKDEEFSGASSSESEDDSGDDEVASQKRLLRQLNNVGASDLIDESLPGARLANMKFMRNAEASRRKENDAMVEDIRRELAGEESASDQEEEQDIGRRTFGPGSKAEAVAGAFKKANQFEEPLPSDEEGDELEIHGVDNSKTEGLAKPKRNGIARPLQRQPSEKEPETSSGGAWSKVPLKSDAISRGEAKRRKNKNDVMDVELDLSQAAVISKQPKGKKATRKTATTLEVESEDDSDDENALRLPFAIKDQELIKRAFAGADVVGEFEAEKKQTIEDEDEKVVDNTIPGWGSWVGDGVSKKEKQRHKGRFLTKIEGIKEKDRKDAKLDRVIINQKRAKKNGKYLASNLPHPFETRAQYERSLRLPVGPEWTTKETFQEATKPRVMLKQGIIAPMSKPMA